MSSARGDLDAVYPATTNPLLLLSNKFNTTQHY